MGSSRDHIEFGGHSIGNVSGRLRPEVEQFVLEGRMRMH